MGFFTDIVADSRYTPRRPVSSLPAAGAEMNRGGLPEQPQRPNQAEPIFSPNSVAAQDSGQDAGFNRSVERRGPSQIEHPSDRSDRTVSAQTAVAPTQAAIPPIFSAADVTAGAHRIQRKSMNLPPASVQQPNPSVVTRRAEKIHSNLVVPHKTAAVEERASKVKTADRCDALTPAASGQTAGVPPSQRVYITPASPEAPMAQCGQVSDESPLAKAVIPTEVGPLSQPNVDDGQPSPSPVIAGVVEQVSPSVSPVVSVAAESSRSTSTAKTMQPQVRIGQVNVIVEAPEKPKRAPTSTSTGSDMVSRNFLRSL